MADVAKEISERKATQDKEINAAIQQMNAIIDRRQKTTFIYSTFSKPK